MGVLPAWSNKTVRSVPDKSIGAPVAFTITILLAVDPTTQVTPAAEAVNRGSNAATKAA